MKETDVIQDAAELPQKFHFDPKQGIDNPALSLADDVDLYFPPQPRFCVLTKPEGGTFGFFLHHDQCNVGHVIRQVEAGGPAQRSGLHDGDRLLEVNGEYVDDMNPLRVAQKIKNGGKQVSLAVLDEKSYLDARARHLNTAMLLPACADSSGAWPKPRLCYIRRVENSFGFIISASEGEKAPFHLMVTGDGPAEAAGVPQGSKLLELNGARVRHLTKTQVNKKLKQAGPAVSLLVMDTASEKFYCSRGLEVTAAMADPITVPFKVRKLPLVKGPDGYGFLLRQEKHTSMADGQFLREVDAGLPAEKAGMKDGDRLLAVNGKPVQGLSHEDVVGLICGSGKRVTLLVIDSVGDQFYSMLGLSPLIFYEEELVKPANIPSFYNHPQPTVGSNKHPTNGIMESQPRQCHLNKESSGYGFHFGKITDEDEVFITQVIPDGPAHRAGLRQGDLLIKVNDINVEKQRYDDVMRMLKEEDTGQPVLLVVDSEGYSFYKNPGLPIHAGEAESNHSVLETTDNVEVRRCEE